MLSLGTYPDVPLKRAREKRNEARRLLTDGINPAAKRVPERAAAIDSFEAVACEWFAKQKPTWAESHADKVITRLEQDLFPWLGAPAVGKVTAAELLACLRRIVATSSMRYGL
jgi:hypothetical protein